MKKHANFRENPALIAMMRLAIAHAARGLPEPDDETRQEWLLRYREAAGERTADSKYSYAKAQFDQHFSQFRAQYPKMLGQYLVSQLDQAQGREALWPAYDNLMPDLVPDQVIERRMAIDELTRLIDIEAEEGVNAFQPLLGEALGRDFNTLRDNPLRPAVFFHALGLTWSTVAGNDRDELFMLGHYAKALAPKIATVYPTMTGLLRKSLNRAKPAGLQSLAGSGGKDLYERSREGAGSKVRRVRNDTSTQTSQASGASPTRSGPLAASQAAQYQAGPLLDHLDELARRLEPALQDATIPADIRIELARIQTASARRFLINPAVAQSRSHALWGLIQDLGDVSGWQGTIFSSAQQDAVRLHLYLIRELLSRDRRATAEQCQADEDESILSHLRSQFLFLRGRPSLTPAAVTPPAPAPLEFPRLPQAEPETDAAPASGKPTSRKATVSG